MKTIFLDSSILLSYILQDSNYEIAKKFLLDLTSEHRLYLSGMVLGEIVNVLTKYKIKKEVIQDMLLNIKEMDIVVLSFEPTDWLDEIHDLAKTVSLKSIDLFILLTWQINKIDLFVTLDSKLAEAYNLINNQKHEK